MNKLTIYRSGKELTTINIDRSAVFSEKMPLTKTVTCPVNAAIALDVRENDYILHNAEIFKINIAPKVTKTSASINKKYELIFESNTYDLQDTYVRHNDQEVFPFYGDAQSHVQLLLDNANRNGSGWNIGKVDQTEDKNIDYDWSFIHSALLDVAELFKLDLRITGKTIHMVKNIGRDTGLILEYGRRKGLHEITRSSDTSKNIVNRVYGIGGTRNLGLNYREGKEKNLVFESRFVETPGVSAHTERVKEGKYENAEIFPQFKGVVKSAKVEKNGNGEVISFEISDDTIDFVLSDYYQKDVNAKVSFLNADGPLVGVEFEIVRFDSKTKTITANSKKDDSDYLLPNATIYPKQGDVFTIYDIYMPDSYIANAEARLMKETATFLDENKDQRLNYDVVLDPHFLRENQINLAVGDLVVVNDRDLGINETMRFTEISYPLVDTYAVTALVGNEIRYDRVVKLFADVLQSTQDVKRVDHKTALLAKRATANLRELEKSVFATDGTFDSAKMNIGVLTAALGIYGVRSQNFLLSGVYITDNYGGNANAINITAGELIHMEISNAGNKNIWQMQTLTQSGLTPASRYYVYSKCSKIAQVGSFVISADQILPEAVDGYYMFLTGLLYPVLNGTRDSEFTNGITSINGNRIKTGKIESPSGELVINLLTSEIFGKVSFKSAVGTTKNLADVDSAITNLDVGGANLMPNSLYLKMAATNTNTGLATLMTDEGVPYYRVVATSAIRTQFPLYSSLEISLVSGKKYTFSVEVRTSAVLNNLSMFFYAPPNNITGTVFSVPATNTWTKIYYTMEYSGQNRPLALQGYSTGTFSIDYRRFKLEAGNMPTDWTPAAIDVQKNISAAQEAADKAAEDANEANKLLADIADDNLLVSSEKQDVLKEWQAIQGAYSVQISQAGVYGVSTTDYISKYNALNTYITPLLSSLTTNSTIVGSTFRANFNNFYISRDNLLSAISTAAKTLVDNIQVGGRNYLRNSNFATTTPYWQAYGSATVQILNGKLRVTATAAGVTFGVNFSGLSSLITFSTAYTFSGWVTTSIATTYGVYIAGSTGVAIAANTPTRFLKTGSTSATSKLIAFLVSAVKAGDYFELELVKFESGNKATDWTLAPEDVQENITTAQTTATNAANAVTSAQGAADKANNALADIANDDMLIPSEKQDVLKEWQVIQGEKPTITAQAGTYAISTSSYDSAYSSLNTYITPLLNDLTTKSAIAGSTFRSTFKAYYDAKTALLKLISDKAKSLADTAQSTANGAVKDAADAAVSAKKANDALADIANDDLLVPSEKQDVLKEWQAIQGAYSVQISQAGVYGVSTTDYISKYNALNTYITPLLSSLTTNSTIVGSTFRANFNNFYVSRDGLLSAISTAAKALVDNIKVGGRNYFRNSNFAATTAYWSAYGSATVQILNGKLRVTATAAGVAFGVNLTSTALAALINFSTEYTFSGRLTTSIATTYGVYIASATGGSIAANTQTQITKTGSTSSNSKLIALLITSNNIGDYFDLEYIKLESGNKATDWTLAPEDVQENITTAQTTATNAANAVMLAQGAADKANNALADIANDDMLIPSEKQDVLKEWQVIQSEKPTITAQAGTYAISTSSYDSAYSSLNTYIMPLLNDLTTKSAIAGSTFRSTFKAYYDAKTALLKLISDKAKSLADTAQSTANGAVKDAADAAVSAKKANDALADIANDDLLVPSEKQDVLKEWQAIQGTYSVQISQAGVYGVSTADYISRYNALNTYITPLLSSLTTNSTIVGTTFRANFNNFYVSRDTLLSAISTAAKALADANTKLINGKSYAAGRMLNRDPEFSTGNNGLVVYNNSFDGSVFIVRQANSALNNTVPNGSGYFLTVRPSATASPGYGGFTFNTQAKANGVFIVRMLVYMNAGQTLNWASNAVGNGAVFTWNTPNTSAGGWQEYIGTLKCGQTGTFSTSNYFYVTGSVADINLASATVYDMTAAEYDFKALSDQANQALLALQNDTAAFKATYNAFTAKIKDMAFQDVVEFAKLGSTVIDGGYVRTNLLNVNAIWANIINAGYINAGQIEALNVVAKTLAAVSGTIGGIKISDNSIYSENGLFSVTKDGVMKATKADISGDITIGTQAGSVGDNQFTRGWKLSGSAMLSDGYSYNAAEYGNNFALVRGTSRYTGDKYNEFAFGTELVPASTGGSISQTAYIRNNRPKTGSTTNIALEVSATGADKNIALNITNGTVSMGGGQCVKVVVVSADNYQMTDQDYVVISNANIGRTIYGPSSPLEGRIIKVRNSSLAAPLYLILNGSTINISSNSTADRVYSGGSWYTI